MPPEPDSAEETFRAEVRRQLPRNFVAHLAHGLLGQTGFRLLNAPTFVPAYIHLLSGSDLAVGLARALQSFGMALSPILGATTIEHRRRVLPVGFVVGGLMRVQVLGIALAAFLLPPRHGAAGRDRIARTLRLLPRHAGRRVQLPALEGDPGRATRPTARASQRARGPQRGRRRGARRALGGARRLRQRFRRDLPRRVRAGDGRARLSRVRPRTRFPARARRRAGARSTARSAGACCAPTRPSPATSWRADSARWDACRCPST